MQTDKKIRKCRQLIVGRLISATTGIYAGIAICQNASTGNVLDYKLLFLFISSIDQLQVHCDCYVSNMPLNGVLLKIKVSIRPWSHFLEVDICLFKNRQVHGI